MTRFSHWSHCQNDDRRLSVVACVSHICCLCHPQAPLNFRKDHTQITKWGSIIEWGGEVSPQLAVANVNNERISYTCHSCLTSVQQSSVEKAFALIMQILCRCFQTLCTYSCFNIHTCIISYFSASPEISASVPHPNRQKSGADNPACTSPSPVASSPTQSSHRSLHSQHASPHTP